MKNEGEIDAAEDVGGVGGTEEQTPNVAMIVTRTHGANRTKF